MRVLVDMDGVLVNWEKGVFDAAEHSDAAPVFREVMSKRGSFGWNLADALPIPQREWLVETISSPGFFRGLQPIEGALSAVEGMLAVGWEVVACSAPPDNHRSVAYEKATWLTEHLGRAFAKNLVLTQRKDLVAGDLLIDDRPDPAKGRPASWAHVVFDQPYNRAAADLPRILRWKDWPLLEQHCRTNPADDAQPA